MKTLRSIYYGLPISLRYIARRLYYLPLDMLRDDDGYPPKGMIYTGGGDFKKTGYRFLELFKTYALLKPTHSVLDIGSGIGRMALPLTQYLENKGNYTGVDLVEKGIHWCQLNISTKYPNFNFIHLALDNDLYVKSKQKAATYRFPFNDESFDTIFLVSVFTHMDSSEIANYLKEIYRMLKPGGRCFFTCFHYYNKQRLQENNNFSFSSIGDQVSYMSKKVKMANVALERSFLTKLLSDAKLDVIHDLKGNWHKPSNEAKDFQDIIVVEKSGKFT